MNVGVDIDGTTDSFPRLTQSMMSAFMAAGHRVYVITGVEGDKVAESDVEAKTRYLTGLGISKDCYTQMIVCPRPHPKNKAKAIVDNDIEVLFDNKKKNVKKASKRNCAAFLLWNSREK